ncbi:DUF1311 domain-containing protein [Diaphorobacter sp. HDW4A]|uniref:lysozyme inhibitor LprI family protein n=1 Tax=Diaphorobacter sp. HDW4A TaxID=2714924 RepID=UPI00140B2B01|nr:lysozyme inhibitor LprI family protein [Diaphorobacter sp. HDW4A]QIL80057.1 DUF1311 domain-containing protein [Diaphorobacter sp. HDW4A]
MSAKSKLTSLIALAAHVALPFALSMAATTTFAQAGANCVPDGSVAEVNACAVKKFQEADSALNIYYGDVMTALSAHERPELRQDQKNWQRSRRDYCNRHNRGKEGKPEWIQLYHECMVKVTQSRRTALSQWLHTGNPPPPEASLPTTP